MPWHRRPEIFEAFKLARDHFRVGPTNPKAIKDLKARVKSAMQNARGGKRAAARLGLQLYKTYMEKDEFGNMRYEYMYDFLGKRLSTQEADGTTRFSSRMTSTCLLRRMPRMPSCVQSIAGGGGAPCAAQRNAGKCCAS